MNKSPESKHRIRFKDCDPHGHLNNTRFIEYMFDAREDHLMEHYQLDLMEYTETRKMAWILIKHEINYLKEAKRNENVIIKTSVIQTDVKSIIVEYQMWNEDKTQLKAILWSRFIHVDIIHKKTCPHPEEIQEMLESLLNPVVETSLDERLKSLMSR